MAFRVCLIVLFVFGSVSAQVNVRLVTDEAEAVLSVLAKRKANQTIAETDWQRIFQSEGYVRLKKRETSMQRSFEDADFKTFVLSDVLAQRAPALEVKRSLKTRSHTSCTISATAVVVRQRALQRRSRSCRRMCRP